MEMMIDSKISQKLNMRFVAYEPKKIASINKISSSKQNQSQQKSQNVSSGQSYPQKSGDIEKEMKELLNGGLEFTLPDKSVQTCRYKTLNVIKANPSDVETFALESKLIYQQEKNGIVVQGDSYNISNFLGALYKAESANFNSKPKEPESEYALKELELSPCGVKIIQEIEDKLPAEGIVSESLESKLVVGGYIEKLAEMMSYLYEKELEFRKEIKPKDNDIKTFFNKTAQIRINISVFLRTQIKEVFALAKKSNVKVDIKAGIATISAKIQDITSFQSSLKALEAQIKAPLYPKFWSHDLTSNFELIEIYNQSEEYNFVLEMFKKTLPSTKITRLQRIQNTNLMENYLLFLEKWKENFPNLDPNRRLIFHGTRQTDPAAIAQSPTGLDLQYARYGVYGKGLYFGSTAAVSHGPYHHRTPNGKFKMMLVDVILGKSYASSANNQLIKAPDGFHSVEANSGSANSFFIIYHNYHSYPLYIVEYELGDSDQNQSQGLFAQARPGLFSQTPLSLFGPSVVQPLSNNNNYARPSGLFQSKQPVRAPIQGASFGAPTNINPFMGQGLFGMVANSSVLNQDGRSGTTLQNFQSRPFSGQNGGKS